MSPRRLHRSSEPGRAPSGTIAPRRAAVGVLALQRAMGNRDTTRLLARKGDKNKGTYENSVQVGKAGPIEITEANLDEWKKGGTDAPDKLTVTSVKGKHSDELKRLADSRERVDVSKVTAVPRQKNRMGDHNQPRRHQGH